MREGMDDYHCGQTYPMAASDSFTLGRSRSSRNLKVNSVNRRSFRSAMFCFLFLMWTGSPPARMAYAGDMSR